MIKLFTLLLFLFLSPLSVAENSDCNPEKGSEFIQQNKLSQAYLNLKGCAKDKNSTALALAQLALLYGWFGYGDFDSEEERYQKVYELDCAAAMMGEEDALMTLVSIFRNGEPIISLAAQPAKALCLKELSYLESYTEEQFKRCMSKE